MGWSLKKELGYKADELGRLPDIMENLAYGHHYDQVFSCLLDYCLATISLPAGLFREEGLDEIEKSLAEPMRHWDKKYHGLFEEFSNELAKLYQIHSGFYNKGCSWYDPWGNLYMAITSRWKSSAMGQFFTPDTICEFMARIVGAEPTEKGFNIINEPCAGSGRLPMASFYEHIRSSVPAFVCAQDLDPVCCKMCAVNFAWNGVGGEIIQTNSLLGNEATRRSWKVLPMRSLFDGANGLLMDLMLSLRFGPDARKMYIVVEVPNESTYYWAHNVAWLERAGQERMEREKQNEQERIQQNITRMEDQLRNSLFGNGDAALREAAEKAAQNGKLQIPKPARKRT